MKRPLFVAASVFIATPLLAQVQAPPPSHTYTLTADQYNVLRQTISSADFWLKVRAGAAGNTLDGHAFVLAQQELARLAAELQRQDTEAARKAAEAAKTPEPKTPEPKTPEPAGP